MCEFVPASDHLESVSPGLGDSPQDATSSLSSLLSYQTIQKYRMTHFQYSMPTLYFFMTTN